MTEFFDKLKKGMDIENVPQAKEPPGAPEADLTSTIQEPEPIEEKPVKKGDVKKKTARKKKEKPKKPLEEKKIKVKQTIPNIISI